MDRLCGADVQLHWPGTLPQAVEVGVAVFVPRDKVDAIGRDRPYPDAFRSERSGGTARYVLDVSTRLVPWFAAIEQKAAVAGEPVCKIGVGDRVVRKLLSVAGAGGQQHVLWRCAGGANQHRFTVRRDGNPPAGAQP